MIIEFHPLVAKENECALALHVCLIHTLEIVLVYVQRQLDGMR